MFAVKIEWATINHIFYKLKNITSYIYFKLSTESVVRILIFDVTNCVGIKCIPNIWKKPLTVSLDYNPETVKKKMILCILR